MCGYCMVDCMGGFGGVGEGYVGYVWVGGQCCIYGGVVVWQELYYFGWYVGIVQQFYCVVVDQVGLFGWFGDDVVVGGQCGGDLVQEDCQWEVLWVDVDEYVVVVQLQFVGFIGWVGQFFGVVELFVCLFGVVVQEIYGFVYFGDVVGQVFVGFFYVQCYEFWYVCFQLVGGVFEDGGVVGGWGVVLGWLCGYGICQCFLYGGGIGGQLLVDYFVGVGWVGYWQ